jgi:hypothetical protein
MNTLQNQLEKFRKNVGNYLVPEKIINQNSPEMVTKILGKKEAPHMRFWFGKHNGKLLDTVAKEDPNYLKWLITEAWFAEQYKPSFDKVVAAMDLYGIEHD